MVSDAPDDFDRKTAEPIHKVILHYQSIICVHTVTPFHVPNFVVCRDEDSKKT